MKLPPLADGIARRMMQQVDGAQTLSPAQLKKYELLKNGDPAPLVERVAELDAKRALNPAEFKELKELKDALGELKTSGWQPKKAAGGVGNFIDRMQSGLDLGTTAAGVGSMATAATGIGVVPGAVVNVASNVADLASAGVDLVQAGVAAATGDFAGAGMQLKDAGLRAVAAIPIIGDSIRAGQLAGKVASTAAKTAKSSEAVFEAARKADIVFPELKVSGPSHARSFSGTGKSTSLRGEDLIANSSAAGIGNTTAQMFENLLYKKLKADPALAKDPNAFQEAYTLALGKLRGLDRLRPANGQMTEQVARDAAKRFDDAVGVLKGLPVEAGSAHAQMIGSLEKSRDVLTDVASSWKAGLKTVQLSAPRGPIFDWLR